MALDYSTVPALLKYCKVTLYVWPKMITTKWFICLPPTETWALWRCRVVTLLFAVYLGSSQRQTQWGRVFTYSLQLGPHCLWASEPGSPMWYRRSSSRIWVNVSSSGRTRLPVCSLTATVKERIPALMDPQSRRVIIIYKAECDGWWGGSHEGVDEVSRDE